MRSGLTAFPASTSWTKMRKDSLLCRTRDTQAPDSRGHPPRPAGTPPSEKGGAMQR